jgi:Cyclic nucleotide-binding domain/Bacterial PH domain
MSEVQSDFSPERELSPEEIETLVEFLRQIPLFAELRTADLEALVTIAHSEFFAAGGELYHQSEGDNTLYIIQSGEVALTHIDPQGAPNEVGTRETGAWLGESSLLLGEPHDVTVRALNKVAAITFSRKEFKELCDRTPGLFDRLTPKEENARKINAPHYGWQGEDESVVIFVRQHKWALVRSMLVPIGILVVAFGVVALLSQIIPSLTALLVIVALLIPLLIAFYVLIDWSDDYYVVTNKRLVHVDELPIIRKHREEAPLSSITEIQFARHSILAHVLDFGDLRVETFGGGVSMRDIPHPNNVKEAIQREIERVKARARASERSAIRDELRQRIFARTAPATEVEERESVPSPIEQPRPSIFQIMGGALGYFLPRLREVQGDSIIWRKHWIVLLQTAKWPLLGLVATLVTFFIWWNRSVLLNWFPDNLWWVWIVIGLGLFAWYLWLFEDWRNDQYIVTSSRIIDIERRPFLMSETRREAALSKIQTTDLDIPSPAAQLFRYGNVTIRVPGAAIEFKFVKDPAGVQAEITKRIAEFNRRVALNDARGRHTELSDWFAAYNQIQHQPQRPEINRPPVLPKEQSDNDSP